MSYIPEYHENYYRVEGTAFNQGKIGIGTINPVQLLHVSGGNIRLDGTGFFNGDLNVTGNLNVYGSTAQFAVSQVIAEDKSIELNAATGSPIGGGSYTTSAFTNDAGADEGGLVLKSTQGDKVILYETVTPASGWVSNLRWVVSGNYGKNTLQLSDANANVGMTIGTDANSVNLYRSANDILKTDDSLIVDGSLTVNGNTTLGSDANDTVTINAGPVNLPNATSAADALVLGTDAVIYRSAANTLTVDDNFSINFNGGKTTLALVNTTADVGLTIGADTNLYRSAANTLKTDDNLIVDGYTMRSVSPTVTAGTDSQGQSPLTKDINIITTNASNPGAVTLPTAQAGMTIMIRNTTANGLKIYPATSARIDALSSNAAFGTTLTTGITPQKEFYAISATQWYSV